ncbi:related to UBP12 - ubiquitin C-terminal hydrolase [Melanopsichium pennsylvanicum]|uniref:ubiquitinyl hydrolase 1 n=2 Tax=Melanopsichium pennsylvanicum TaxID=63383 RepID=A0AAJ4XQT6_9BASI|nr:related to UBP12-ubiquitin C-terminal hydrolase [Melanopsichium pennsylvanicum 4]SNX86256.1 related to UBP12 - ubiquitin C-terminal hydrolase [Melanopsichium pennsylvanicum]
MRSDTDHASSPHLASNSNPQVEGDSSSQHEPAAAPSTTRVYIASPTIRRPAPSQLSGPEPRPSSRSTSASSATEPKRSSAYKRARTVSPIIDENSSDVENETRSNYSRSASDHGESDPAETSCSTQPTPLRQSVTSADLSQSTRAMSSSDQNIEGLMTEKSLSLHDGAAASSTVQMSESTVNEQPPSYQDAIHSPPSSTQRPSHEPRPSGQQQLDRIRPMKNRPLHAGDTWYLVSRKWYRRWDTACSEYRDSDPAEKADIPIGPIDNSDLLDENSTPSFARLRPGINEHIDYEMLPEEGWKLIIGWYASSGPEFSRSVIEGLSEGQESVEFYPPIIRLLKLSEAEGGHGSGVPSFSLSVSASLAQLKAKAKTSLNLGDIADADIRLLHFPEPTDQELRTGLVRLARADQECVGAIDAGEDKPDTYRPEATLKSIGVDEIEMTLVVETRQSGRWQTDPAPVEASATSVKGIFAQQGDFFSNLQQTQSPTSTSALGAASTAGETSSRITRSQTASDRTMGRSRGLRGLNNLGNTCFMNSALQCLSNTYELQQYFVSGAYKEELNTDNPLGMGGAIADAFGNLITNIWNGQGSSFWPREFKFALSRFAPQFSGYAQHDSQELLAFLLDGLHEDLNRILKKPYIEAPDWEGGDEKDLVAFAKRQWDIYKARNDSVIVDLFQGQYRSTLVCPECSKVSIKFDPFMYLTLPIPNKKMWRGQVYFVPQDPATPMQKFQVQLPAGSTIGRLRQKVGAQFGVETKRLVCGEVWHHRIYKWVDDYEPLIDIKDGDFVYFWEVPAAPKISKQRQFRYHRSVEDAENALEIPDEDYAILPVFANFANDALGASSSSAFVSRRSQAEAVGIPFFISIPKAEVNDVEAVRRHVVEGFSRFASNPDDLFKVIKDADDADAAEQAPAPHISDREMVDDNAADQGAVEVVAPSQVDDSDVVTEIREDGEAVVVPDISLTTPLEDAGAHSIAITPSQHPGVALQTEPIFRIRFSVAEAGQCLPKGSESGADHLSEELGERHARLSKRSAAADPTVEELQMEEEMDELDSGHKRAKKASFSKPIPLVFTGGAIVCTWSHSIKERNILVESDSAQLWGEYGEVIDDAIRERETAGPARPKILSIEDCMDEFTREEQLGEDDPWYCPGCKEFRQATKKFDLWKAPDILVVHLKRFSAGRHSRDKLNVLVDFPLEGLDLADRVEGTQALRRVRAEAKESGEELSESMLGSGILRPLEDNDDAVAVDAPIYDLYAVDNHFGGLGGGHYTAFAKSPADGKWYEFDDSSVRPVANPETVKSSSAYLLFYRRRTTRPIGGKSRQRIQEAAKTKATFTAGTTLNELAPDSGAEGTSGEGYSSDSSSHNTPDWSLNMRSAEDASGGEPAAGWSSTGGSPANSSRPVSPVSDTGLESP